MGRRDLDNFEYDEFLSQNKKEKELRDRRIERRNANKGYEGYHFGISDNGKPVYTKDKAAFKKELEARGLMMRDDVRRSLR